MKKITRTTRLAAAVSVAAVIAGVAFSSAPASATSPSSRTVLKVGETMSAGDYLNSTSGQYTIDLQADGNLVEYGNGQALWSTKTAGNPGATFSIQGDDNAVLRSKTGKALWSSGTSDPIQTKGWVTLGNDGQFNVLRSDHSLRWHNGAPGTDTLGHGTLHVGDYLHAGPAKLTFQGDQNLVATVNGKVTWSSKTQGKGGAAVTLQADGNLVMRGAHDAAVWSSGTPYTYSNRLVLSPAGKVSLYEFSTLMWTAR